MITVLIFRAELQLSLLDSIQKKQVIQVMRPLDNGHAVLTVTDNFSLEKVSQVL